MTHTGDDGYGCRGDGSGHNLFVEAPKILDASAPASQDDDVAPLKRVDSAKGRRERKGRASALHGRVGQNDGGRGVPAIHGSQDVSQCGAALAGDDPNRLGAGRHWSFSVLGGQAFFAKLGEAILVLQLQCAQSFRLDAQNRQLQGAPAFVHGDPATHDDFMPVFGSKPEHAQVVPPHDALQLSPTVFEREIGVARTEVDLKIGDFAGHKKVRVVAFQFLAEGSLKLVDRENR